MALVKPVPTKLPKNVYHEYIKKLSISTLIVIVIMLPSQKRAINMYHKELKIFILH